MILLPGVLIGLFVFYSKGYFARFQIMFERILQSNGSAGIDFSSGRIFLWETTWKLFCNNPYLGNWLEGLLIIQLEEFHRYMRDKKFRKHIMFRYNYYVRLALLAQCLSLFQLYY